MAYVPVPKDLTKVKTKVMFNLTKRQLVCFGGGALVGVPLFFSAQRAGGDQRGIHVHDRGAAPVLSAGDV